MLFCKIKINIGFKKSWICVSQVKRIPVKCSLSFLHLSIPEDDNFFSLLVFELLPFPLTKTMGLTDSNVIFSFKLINFNFCFKFHLFSAGFHSVDRYMQASLADYNLSEMPESPGLTKSWCGPLQLKRITAPQFHILPLALSQWPMFSIRIASQLLVS